jgi:hypothetical protein
MFNHALTDYKCPICLGTQGIENDEFNQQLTEKSRASNLGEKSRASNPEERLEYVKKIKKSLAQ